jgi:type IV secretion system protein VirB2
VTGPVAIGIAILAIATAGMTLIFGGEMNEFTRKMIMVVLVVSIIVFAAQLLTNLTGKSATIPTCENTQAVTCSNQ